MRNTTRVANNPPRILSEHTVLERNDKNVILIVAFETTQNASGKSAAGLIDKLEK